MREILSDNRGVVALKFALALPALGLLAAGAIDLHAVSVQRGVFQATAEAAALAGARELTLAVGDEVAQERAKAFAEAHLADKFPNSEVASDVAPLGDARALNVTISAKRPSYFGNLLPPGGWDVIASATAASVNRTPLCVIASGDTSKKKEQVIEIANDGAISAPGCLIHSNYDISAGKGRIDAGMVQAVTTAQGSIVPAANLGAVPLDDPFAGVQVRTDQSCASGQPKVTFDDGFHTIPAGVHCGGYRLRGTAQATLAPGEHYFLKGDLDVEGDARLTGRDVVLVFDRNSKSDFKGRARIDLEGRRTGPLTGFVLITTRENDKDFKISSDHVDSLLGVIYVPAARLMIEGGKDIAKNSDWTVIVAQSIELKGSPSLVINANYAGSEVAVPDGVGPNKGGSRLVR